ncbi:MAG: beta-galactosidase [Victivallales bacterium]|nr:beta-galactosidase [Victivallales bacterium]
MKSQKLMVFACLFMFMGMKQVYGENLLSDPSIRWGNRVRNGADATVGAVINGTIESERRNRSGEVMILNENYLSLTPGKYYQVEVEAAAATQKQSVALMLQMPGSKRRPFPITNITLAAGEKTRITMNFHANEDEKSLRIHIIHLDPGKLLISQIQCGEISEATYMERRKGTTLTSWKCSGDSLGKIFKAFNALDSGIKEGILEAKVLPYGNGFIANNVAWAASKIETVEVTFRAFDEGGHLYFNFKCVDDGKELSSFMTAAMPADGKFHTIRFNVAQDKAWRGQVKELKLSWHNLYNPCRISLASIEAKSFDNLIVNADRLKPGTSNFVDLIKPRGNYLLEWKGQSNPGIRLELLDRRHDVIETIELPKNEMQRKFSAPELTVNARLSIGIDGSGIPVLKLLELPPVNRNDSSWKAKWIWSRNGSGPNNTTVWFRREFKLADTPVNASLLATGDDSMEAIINGKYINVSSAWDIPGLIDISKLLKTGNNEVILKVHNHQAWGGAIAELYINSKNDKDIWILTDESWKCAEGSKQPALIDKDVHVIGSVPAMPWGNRLGYQYIGPKVQVSMLESSHQNFTLDVIQVPVGLFSDKLGMRLVMPDGSSRQTQAIIRPPLSEWKPGRITVAYTLPPQSAKHSGEAMMYIESPMVKVVNQLPAGKISIGKSGRKELAYAAMTGAGSRPWFVINGEKIPPIYYDLPGNFITGPEQRDFLVRNAVSGGHRVIRMAHNVYDIWKAPGRYDFSSIDKAMETIVLNAPDAYVLMVSATYMPRWWLEKNPDEAVKFHGGEALSRGDDFQTISSRKWLDELRVFYSKLFEHIRKSSYAGKIIGLAPTDGSTWEWMWSHGRGHSKRVYSGWAPADINAYRAFLRKKYKTDEQLARAWNRPDLRFEKVLPPTPERIDQASVVDMLDPSKDMDIIDYSIARNEILSDSFIAICKMIKDNSNNQWLAGSYYGYMVMFSFMSFYLQDGGHMRISKIARSPYVDFVYGPTVYHWRKLGVADGPMQPAEAFSSHGKTVICELDVRTFTEKTEYEARNGRVNTVDQSVSMMNRAFGMMLTRGMGGHWMEMYERWFCEPVLLELMKYQLDLYRDLPEKPAGTTPREVCVVSDEDSTFHVKTNMGNGIHVSLIAELMRRLPETGVSFGHVLKDDLLEPGKIPPHKMYIITNLFLLDEKERSALIKRFEEEKATVLWLYAPGAIMPGQKPDAINVSKLLGPGFTMLKSRQNMQLKCPGADDIICRSITGPWFLPVDGFDQIIATTQDNSPAIVKWRRNNTVNYFSPVPNLSPKLLRDIAAEAGVHIYSDSGDPVSVGNDFIFLHAKTGGEKSFRLREGQHARAIAGPLKGNLISGQKWQALPGQTYGFMIETHR